MDGLGFGLKWMMGWMHDTLSYFKTDPLLRAGVQDKFSFSMMYYYDENFMLPLSHDEVVHGKSPMIYKMPGDEWQKFANLRLLYAYMFMHPGAKLLFMGNEFAATTEWNYKTELPWNLLQFPSHGGMKYCVQKLNELYTSEPALYENQFDPSGFEWVDLQHRSESVMAFKRKGKNPAQDILVVINATPVVRQDWKIKVQGKTSWQELFNSDAKEFWGTGVVYNPLVPCVCVDKENSWYELTLQLPALSAVVLK
jgi:1,4-alpha-glucan branching enzyme